MLFSKCLALLALGASSSFAVPVPAPAANDVELATHQNDVLPLTLFSVFQTLNEAVKALDPGLEGIINTSGGAANPAAAVVPLISNIVDALNTATSQLATLSPGDQGAANEDLADLINSVLDDLFQALNTLLPKLGLTGATTGLDTPVAGLLTSLNGSLLPGVLSLVGGLVTSLSPLVGGLVGGLGVGNL